MKQTKRIYQSSKEQKTHGFPKEFGRLILKRRFVFSISHLLDILSYKEHEKLVITKQKQIF